MTRSRTIGIAKSVCVVSVVAICLFGAYKLSEAIYYANVEGQGLESEFGFRLETPYLYFEKDGDGEEVAKLTYVATDGKLGRQGFRSGDILEELHPHEFYKQLSNVRSGKTATVKILRGADSEPLRNHEQHTLTVSPDEQE